MALTARQASISNGADAFTDVAVPETYGDGTIFVISLVSVRKRSGYFCRVTGAIFCVTLVTYQTMALEINDLLRSVVLESCIKWKIYAE